MCFRKMFLSRQWLNALIRGVFGGFINLHVPRQLFFVPVICHRPTHSWVIWHIEDDDMDDGRTPYELFDHIMWWLKSIDSILHLFVFLFLAYFSFACIWFWILPGMFVILWLDLLWILMHVWFAFALLLFKMTFVS